MKAIKTFAAAFAAILTLAACNKETVGDAVVGFSGDSYEFCLEDGPNFDVPLEISGSGISYPFTVTVTSLPETEENGYSERNVDYRFIERNIVVNSADEKPVVTLRIINSSVEMLKVGLQITGVEGGKGVGTVATTEVLVLPQVAYHTGNYDVTGTYINEKGEVDENYSEVWEFVSDGSDVGFYGLLGMTSDMDIWPIIGASYRDEEDGMLLMDFEIGLENYITAGYFNFPEVGRTACYVAPIIVAGRSAYLTGTLTFGAPDRNAILIGLSEGMYLTYGLFDYETGGFVGYTFGGMLAVDDNTITRSAGAASAGPSASPAGVSDKISLVKLEDGTSFATSFEKIATPVKVR